jgi:hypothetical protein
VLFLQCTRSSDMTRRRRSKGTQEAQGKPPRGVGGGDLAAQLTQLQSVGLSCWGVAMLHIDKSPHNTLDSLFQKIKEVMGSLHEIGLLKALPCFFYMC